MKAFLKFIGKSALNAITGGFGGDFLEMCQDVWNNWGKNRSPAERKADVEALVQTPAAAVQQEVKEVVRELAGDQAPEVQLQLESYLDQVPAVTRQSLRRRDNPRGDTVPKNMPLTKAADLAAVLPRLPRFKPGARPIPADLELVELLGVGGFGEVWKARHLTMTSRTPSALKFCLDLDPEAKKSILAHEARIHDLVTRQGVTGIVELRNTYLSADPPCLEYEFIEGGDLASLLFEQLQKNPAGFDPATIYKFMLELAQTMGKAHRLKPPVVHRDLKPANILCQRQPDGTIRLRIADFGIGGVASDKAIQETRRAQSIYWQATAVRGAYAPNYASPQQMSGEAPDPRDDIHALGVIWYQLLIGDLTKPAPAGQAWRQTLATKGVSNEALDLMEQCFVDDATYRIADASVLAERLEKLTHPDRGSSVTPPPTPSRTPEQDLKDALEEARTKGNWDAYIKSEGPKRVETWQTAAGQGDAAAQCLLAACLQEGAGIPKDEKAAVSWLQQAAGSGLAAAQGDLGGCYGDGIGVPKDLTEAVRWDRKAAAQKDAWGQRNLGYCYHNGEGVPEDHAEAVRWYRLAAEQDLSMAMVDLGGCYEQGEGVAADPAEAFRWYRKAADLGPRTSVSLRGRSYSYKSERGCSISVSLGG